MSSNRLRSTTGCLTCRQRHVKCDEIRPICRRCQIGARDCVRPEDKPLGKASRKTTSPTPSHGSHWGNVSGSSENIQLLPSLRLSEEANVTSGWGDGPSRYLATQDCIASPRAVEPQVGIPVHNANPALPALSCPPQRTADILQSCARGTLNQNVSVHCFDDRAAEVPTEPGFVSRDIDILDVQTLQGIQLRVDHSDTRANSPEIADESPSFCVTEREEFLLQHYAKHLGKWFHMSDADRHFSIEVPHLARSSPILLKAVSAFSARHLSFIGGYDPRVAEDFHEQCIRLLIPALSDPECATNDTILAALVLLRLYEHMTVSETGKDNERHLGGISALVASAIHSPWSSSGSGLQRASFWGYFRQCIYAACVHRQPLKFDISSYKIEMRLFTPSVGIMATVEEEAEWCRWITWILAEVVDFCFGTKAQTSIHDAKKAWHSLLRKVEMWDTNKPKTFLPVGINERDLDKGQWFPERWYGSEWHAMANMHYLTARILLDVHDPLIRNVSIGDFGFLRARQQLESKVISNARAICGICLANPGNVATIFTLCHAIFAFASFFSETEERKLLIHILRRAEKEDGWPTTWIINALKIDWDWEDN